MNLEKGDRVRSIFFKDFRPIGTVISVFDGWCYVKWDDIPENEDMRNEETDEEFYVLEKISEKEKYQKTKAGKNGSIL